MKHTTTKTRLSFILCIALIAAIALTALGCTGTNPPESPDTQTTTATDTAVADTPTEADTSDRTTDPNAPTVKGEGATVFYFHVVDKDGGETKFEIHTDKTTVGEALLELGLIEGEEGPYGLYVKRVNGMLADYDVDGTYWALYKDGAYATSGVDTTKIADGEHYELVLSQ